MKNNNCIICKQKTEYMYGLNEGIYCEKHKEVGLYIQTSNLEISMFRERISNILNFYDKPRNSKR